MFKQRNIFQIKRKLILMNRIFLCGFMGLYLRTHTHTYTPHLHKILVMYKTKQQTTTIIKILHQRINFNELVILLFRLVLFFKFVQLKKMIFFGICIFQFLKFKKKFSLFNFFCCSHTRFYLHIYIYM